MRCNPYAGFTLLELLVVLAIGALLIGLIPSSLDRLREGSVYRDTVRSMVVDLKRARQLAVANRQEVQFRVDLDTRVFGIVGQNGTALPNALEVRATTGQSAPTANQRQSDITFLPEGGSSGGTIELVRKSGAGVRIRVDWLFGQLSQQPLS